MENSRLVPENLTTELEKQTWRAVMAARGNSVVLFSEVEQQIYNAIMAAGGCGGSSARVEELDYASAFALPVKDFGYVDNTWRVFSVPSIPERGLLCVSAEGDKAANHTRGSLYINNVLVAAGVLPSWSNFSVYSNVLAAPVSPGNLAVYHSTHPSITDFIAKFIPYK